MLMRLSNYTANLFVSENRTHNLDIPPCGGFGQQNNAIANVLLKNTIYASEKKRLKKKDRLQLEAVLKSETKINP
jgi:hypothetical protein